MNNQYYLSQLTNQELMLVNSEVEKRKKSTAAAYLLCIFLGTLGAHRYYMGKTGSAIAMTLITVLTLGFGTLVTGIWEIVDLFLISGWLQNNQNVVEEQAAQEILNRRTVPNNFQSNTFMQGAPTQPNNSFGDNINPNDTPGNDNNSVHY
ncbi:TM2 domain-containing protein [Secundilactobacillus folii]|uniref:NINE protein n=1 Tax=Secundilactobacillus folii TaxID=2678357 RepID=A0A7X3C1Q4_9LACO|nr:TM2 domain-containing protein [Secundilactobacillus folii]MTV81975.1 NINE protein [Secundilactobacillus folii]